MNRNRLLLFYSRSVHSRIVKSSLPDINEGLLNGKISKFLLQDSNNQKKGERVAFIDGITNKTLSFNQVRTVYRLLNSVLQIKMIILLVTQFCDSFWFSPEKIVQHKFW